MDRNTLLAYLNGQKQFEIHTDVKLYPTLVTVIISLSAVKNLTTPYKVWR